MKKTMKIIALLLFCFCINARAGKPAAEDIIFGKSVSLQKYISGSKQKDKPLRWINVNTDPDTWHLEKDLLVCSGNPIGVMRSEFQYENFILHVEWMHMEPGGNSGVFVWSNAKPPEGQRLPNGVEVQMLELDWVNLNKKDGVLPPIAYVHGELFGVGGVKTVPDNPRGTRSKSIENRCKGKGEWNTYDAVCVDGNIRLSVNGKFVNGITRASQKKGYLCLESEGAEIHFRNLRIIELAPGVTTPEQTAPDFDNEASVQQIARPLSLHPRNPHYFLFREKPAILIGSTEHYGAVMNLDFDYVAYFNELASSGLNVTRTFTGIYVEPQGAFKIEKNSMAPGYGRFICPWSRSKEPGYANGGNKFDLERWDEAYFSRLKDFVAEAGKREIIVELDLFSNYYDTIQWKLSPLYIGNNVNGFGNIKDWKEVLSLRHPEILNMQERMVRKIISELKDFDNLYYEVCNEPYFGDTTALRQWEAHMTGIVADAEKDFKYKHLISNNIANNFRRVPEARPNVSVYNFHYANPPVTVPLNYHLNMVLGDNETGFDGIEDLPYRREAWEFIMSGGALYNNLDYSFTADTEDGTFVFKKGQPGGGGKSLRSQLKILIDFLKDLDYINMKPLNDQVAKLSKKGKTTISGLYNKNQFAVYLSMNNESDRNTIIEINAEAGTYRLNLIDTKTGKSQESVIHDHPGGWLKLTSMDFPEDLAVKMQKL